MSGYGGVGSGVRPSGAAALGSAPSRLAQASNPTAPSYSSSYQSPQRNSSSGAASGYNSGYGAAQTSTYASSSSTDHTWVLEPMTYEGSVYLLDRRTGSVYKDGRENDWPELVGKLGAQGRIEFRHKNTAGDLFHALDDYLKTKRQRFDDVFKRFDADRSGTLEAHEMRKLVKELLPDVNEHELRYFWAMIDTDGDGQLTQEEFLTAAKACLAAEKATTARQTELNDALKQMQRYLQDRTDEARAMFMSLDLSGDGRLSPSEQLAFFKTANKAFTAQQLRMLVSHVRDLYPHGDGSLTLQDLMRAFNASKVQRQAPGSTSPAHHHTSSGGTGGYADSKPSPWELEEVTDAAGRKFLLDNDTKVVFHQLRAPGSWPEVYGKVDARGQVVAIEHNSEGGLFKALDNHLKSSQQRFQDVFDGFSKKPYRETPYLDTDGLLDMLFKLMPKLTKGDLYYFQVMLDVDGDGRITYDEFLSTVKEGMAVERSQQSHASADYSGLDKLSAYIQRHPGEVERLYHSLDTAKKGYLRYPEFGSLLRKALPNISSNEKRSIFTYLSSMDVAQEGHVTLKGLLKVFHKPTVKGVKYGSSGGAHTGAHHSPSHSTSGASKPVVHGKLRVLKVGHKTYLHDPHTNKVFSDDDYPEYVGHWDGHQIHLSTSSTAVTLFKNLDQYLKSAQVRARELFDDFDVPLTSGGGKKGYLDVRELRKLISALMKDVQQGDIRYLQAMIDQNGDGRIEYSEFLDTAKACMADEGRGKSHVEVRDALLQVRQYLLKNKVSAEQLFRKHDVNSSGLLEAREVAAMFRSCMPGLTPQQLRYLLTHLHTITRHHGGELSFNELLTALRVADIDATTSLSATAIQSPGSRGASTAGAGDGYRASSGGAGGDAYRSSSGGTPPPPAAAADKTVSWSLEDWYDDIGTKYLLDRASQIVYKDLPDWPKPVGVLSHGRLQPKKAIEPAELFSRLDAHLKANRMSLDALYSQYDADRDGELTLPELARLVRDLRLPSVSTADIMYFQALMDVDGNGRISQSELLTTNKSVVEAQKVMWEASKPGAGAALPEDVLDLLDRISKYIIDNLDSMKTRWFEADKSRNGFLEPHELTAFLRGLIRGLKPREQHYLLMHLADMDVTGAGTISFQELCISLRAVPPRTPRGVVHKTGFAHKTAAPVRSATPDQPYRSSTSGSATSAAATAPRTGSPSRTPLPGPPSKTWHLKDHQYRGSYYLLDPATNLLYHDASLREWPQLVGMIENGQVKSLGADAATVFFTTLDAYLKEQKTRFQDLFRRYAPRGELDLRELAHLVRDMTPGANDAQIKYFQIVMDTDGDQRISAEELLTAAKDILAKLKTSGAAGARSALFDPSEAPALNAMSDKLYNSMSEAKAVFDSFDTTYSGYLHYDKLLLFFKKMMRVSNAEMRSLITVVHFSDAQHEGKVSFQELLTALRAVDCLSSKGKHARGFAVPASAEPRPAAPSKYGESKPEDNQPLVWELQAYQAPAGSARDRSASYLIDQKTQMLYSSPSTAAEWPQHVGKVDRHGRLVLFSNSASDALEFFKVLDKYLKDHKVRFNDLFAEFDRDRSGHLDAKELRLLIKALLRDVSEAQLAYFQCMLDCGGEVNLTCDEFLTAARQCMSIEKDVQQQELPPDILKSLQTLSLTLSKSTEEFKTLFTRYDSSRTGNLGPRDILRLLREFQPSLPHAAMRYIAVLLNTLDIDGDGKVGAKDVLQALHAVMLSTPNHVYKPGTWFTRGTSESVSARGSQGGSQSYGSKPSTPPKREPIIKVVDLDSFDYERQSYLIDRAAGVVYEAINARNPPDWPKAVGLYDRQARQVVKKPPAASTAQLFSVLDAKLKREQLRVTDLFRDYDRDRKDGLNAAELGLLIKDLLGRDKVTSNDISYFQAMFDLDNNNSVSADELLAVAKTRHDDPHDQFRTLATFCENLISLKERCYDEFLRLDVDGDGTVPHKGLVSLAKWLSPKIRTEELRYLLTHLHTNDPGRGKFTFNDLLMIFRAVPVSYPQGGQFTPGFVKSKEAPRGGARPAPIREVVELREKRFETSTYLVDSTSGYVYEQPGGGKDYPYIVGKALESGSSSSSSQLRKAVYNHDNDLFTYLDHYRKQNPTRLRDVYQRLSTQDRSGGLPVSKLSQLVEEVIPSPTEAELAYCRVMMDYDQDGVITQQELLGAIQDCWELSKNVTARTSSSVCDALSRLSAAMNNDLSYTQQQFQLVDARGTGQLDMQQVAAFIRKILPRVDRKDLRCILAHLHFLDTLGEGSYSLTDLCHGLNVVDLRLPSGLTIKGGAFPKPRVVPRQPLNTSSGGSKDGPGMPRAPLHRAHDGHGDGYRNSSPSLLKEWVLEEWSQQRGGPASLLDPETQLVYVWNKDEKWPALLGQALHDGSVKRAETSTTNAFFKALDEQLKVRKMHLNEFLAAFGIDSRAATQGLDPDEFKSMVYRLLPGATTAQVNYLEAVVDLDGNHRINAQEILEVFKQLRDYGPRLLRLEDAAYVDTLNRLSDVLAKDQASALRAFKDADSESRGSLTPRDLARFLMRVAPFLRATEVRTLQTHLHLLDVNGNGTLEFRELLTSLRAIPVRVGSKLYPRVPFRATAKPLEQPPLRLSQGGGKPEAYSPYKRDQKVASAPVHKPAHRGSHTLSSDDDDQHGQYGHHHHKKQPLSITLDREIVMELQEVSGTSNSGHGALSGSLRRHVQGGGYLKDPDSGLMYILSGAGGARAAWPRMVAYTDPVTHTVMKVEPLDSIRLFRELYRTLGDERNRQMVEDSFARVAAMAGGSAGTSKKGSAQLEVADVVDMVNRMLADELSAHSMELLTALLQLLTGSSCTATKLVRAMAIMYEAHQKLCDTESDLYRLLMTLSTALSANLKAVMAASQQHAVPSRPQHLDASGVMEVLTHVSSSVLKASWADKAGLIMWVFYNCPHAEEACVHVSDLLKAFRAVRCKLPDGRVISPGISVSHVPRGAFDPSKPPGLDSLSGHRHRDSYTGSPSKHVSSSGHIPAYMPAHQLDEYDPSASLRDRQPRPYPPSSPDKLPWSPRSNDPYANLSDSMHSSGRPYPYDAPAVPPPQHHHAPQINPTRRKVALQDFNGPKGSSLAYDPQTGLVYRIASGSSWPDLAGKSSAGGRYQALSSSDSQTVLQALQRIPTDEARLRQLFRTYDKDGSGSLDMAEALQLCRKTAGLQDHQARFVQAMLDMDQSGRISLAEFINGIRGTIKAVEGTLRLDRDVLGVLHSASASISADVEVFWKAFAVHDRDRNAYLDLTELSRFIKDLFQGISVGEVRLIVAFCFLMDTEKDGLVRPDELLLLLRALPLISPAGVTYKTGFTSSSSSYVTDPRAGKPQLPWSSPTHAPAPADPYKAHEPVKAAGAKAGYPGEVPAHYHRPTPHVEYPAHVPVSPPAHPYSPPLDHTASWAATYPAHSATALPTVPPAPTSPYQAVPYMMPGGPGQPPVVGYVLPYVPELYEQLLANSESSAGPSPQRHASPPHHHQPAAWDNRQGPGASDEFSFKPPAPRTSSPGAAYPSPSSQYPKPPAGYEPPAYQSPDATYGKRPPSPGYPAPPPLPHHADKYLQDPRYPQDKYQQDRYISPERASYDRHGTSERYSSPERQYGSPERQSHERYGSPTYGHHHHHHDTASSWASTGTYPGQQQQQYNRQEYQQQQAGYGGGGRQQSYEQYNPMQYQPNHPTTSTYNPTTSYLEGGRPGSPPYSHDSPYGNHPKGRPGPQVPPGKMSVMADAPGTSRRTPFGLMQELQKFLESRHEAFCNHFNMCASPHTPGIRSVSVNGGPGAYQSPVGTVTKTSAVGVLQRAVPSASHTDMWYYQQMIHTALPKHTVLSCEDLMFGIRQCAAVERQLSAGRLPQDIRALMSNLSARFFVSGPKGRESTYLRFKQLDVHRTGTLMLQEQLELLGVAQLAPSCVMWLTAALASVTASAGRQGYLTYEELGEALSHLAATPPSDTPPQYDRPTIRESTGDLVGALKGMQLGNKPGQAYAPPQQGGYQLSPRPHSSGGGLPGYLPPHTHHSAGYSFEQERAGGYQGGPHQGGPHQGGPYTRPLSSGGYAGDWQQPGEQMKLGVHLGGGGYGKQAGYLPLADVPGGYVSGGAGYGQLGEAGHAYFIWTHDNRQKILEKYFSEDHARKVRVLEEQKRALESQAALKKANFETATEMRKVEQGLSNLAKQVEKNAYELTGQPPTSACTVDQLATRIGAALEEALTITRKKAVLQDSLASGQYKPPADMGLLMQQLTSPDWYQKMALPANLETLKVALAVRKDMLELNRLRELEAHERAWEARDAEHHHHQAAHAMSVQTQLLQTQLAAQAAELQNRLVQDAHQAALQAAAVVNATNGALTAMPHRGTDSSPPSSPVRSMRLSPSTWQMEPSPDYSGVSSALAAGFGSYPGQQSLVPRSTCDL